MADSVGRVDLDLGLNYKQFNKELGGISNKATSAVGGAFKKLGLIVAGAFAIGGIIKFGKSAIDLASDLDEVQNVVDVTFGSMSENINSFSKTALATFGLSELSAKKYSSTMGAMLKSSGLAGNQMTEMSKNLTGLSADFASFYNLNNDFAFDKIRAGISGETEPLKQLGINMSVANLEAFALTQGINKQFAAMSQAEQVLLRYNYLLSVSKDAQGDFARTSDSWANQTKLLGEQWRILQGTMGAGFINVLTPVIRVLNTIVLRLQTAAQYFKALTQVLFGAQKASVPAAAGVESVGESAESAASGVKKAGKAVKGSLSSFDELNVIGQEAADSLDNMGGAGGGIDLGDMGEIIAPTINTDEIEAKVQGMVDRVKGMFSTIFDGDYFTMSEPIRSSISSIGNTANDLKNNFLLPLATYIISDFVPSIVGSFTNSFAPVFKNIAESSIEGFAKTFKNVTDTYSELLNTVWIPSVDAVKQAYIEAFPAIAESIQSLLDNTIKPFLDYIINDFVLPIAKAVNETFVPIFSEIAVWAIQEFVKWFQWGADMINDIYITLIQPAFDLVKQIVLDTLAIVSQVWEDHGKNILAGISELMKGIREVFQMLWDKILKPIIIPFLEMLSKAWDEHIKGLLEQVGDFVGKLVEFALLILNKFVIPLIKYLIDKLAPGFKLAFQLVADIVGTLVGVVADVAKGVFKTLGGIIDFLTGVFTGDWKKAWQGVKDIFGGIFDSLGGIVKGALNLVIDGVNSMIRGLNQISFTAPDWVPIIGGKSFGISIPTIPKLAQGGLVDQPTLAMVGDNRNASTDPEVVTPLSKLQDMLATSNQAVVDVLFMILDALDRLDLSVDIDGERLTRIVREYLVLENSRVGGSAVTIGGVPL